MTNNRSNSSKISHPVSSLIRTAPGDRYVHIDKATAGLALVAYSAVFRGSLSFLAGCAGIYILYQRVTDPRNRAPETSAGSEGRQNNAGNAKLQESRGSKQPA